MAKKKIYDIIPPEKRREILGKAKKVSVKSSVVTAGEQEDKRAFVFSKKKVLCLPVLIIISAIVYWFFSTAATVKIELFPRLEALTLETTVLFSTSSSEFVLSPSDLSQTIIPAIPVETEKTFTKEFPSSEVSVEEKAQGTIRVYNKHSRTVSLVEGTRFLSSSEPTRQFHAQKKIVISAGGYVDIPVIASEPGEEYNIEPCVFSVPGLRNFSPPQLYYDVFGKSFANMEGGRKDIIRKVSQESLENAREQLLEIAGREIKAALENVAGSDFEILDNSIELKLIEEGAVNAKEGQEINTFVYQIKVKATGLKAQTSFLLEFAKEFVASNLAAHKDFVEGSLIVRFLSEEERVAGGMVAEGTEIKADLEISTKVYSKVDKDSLGEIVKGRGKGDISRYTLEICPELLKPPRIEFKPFWARRVSLEPANVEIKMSFE